MGPAGEYKGRLSEASLLRSQAERSPLMTFSIESVWAALFQIPSIRATKTAHPKGAR